MGRAHKPRPGVAPVPSAHPPYLKLVSVNASRCKIGRKTGSQLGTTSERGTGSVNSGWRFSPFGRCTRHTGRSPGAQIQAGMASKAQDFSNSNTKFAVLQLATVLILK